MSGNPPGGATTVAAVIGDPIAHSLSPLLHNAAFAACDLDWVFVALRVADGSGPEAIAAMRTFGLAGLSVTMPHKHAVLAALDDLTPMAARLGAVNCVFRDGERLVGDNTDGAGVLWAVNDHMGLPLDGARVGVIGAGGAARAVVAALAVRDVAEVVVVNRTEERAVSAAALAGDRGRPGTLTDLDGLDLVVNATSVGMDGGAPGDPTEGVAWSSAAVMDLIYHPGETPLLRAARARGSSVCNGVPMLIGQAAAAFERWTGRNAPIEAMTAAVAARGIS